MALTAARRLAVAAMSAQQPVAADRAVAHALKDVLTKVEGAVQRAGRTKPVGCPALQSAPAVQQPVCWE